MTVGVTTTAAPAFVPRWLLDGSDADVEQLATDKPATNKPATDNPATDNPATYLLDVTAANLFDGRR